MRKMTFRKGSILLITILALIGILFYAIAHEQLRQKTEIVSIGAIESNVGELLAGDIIEQPIVFQQDSLEKANIFFQTYGRVNTGTLVIKISEENTELFATAVDVTTIADNSFYTIEPHLTGVRDKTLIFSITSLDGKSGNAVTVAYGRDNKTPSVHFDGDELNGSISMNLETTKLLWFGTYYWYIFFALLGLLGAYLIYMDYCSKRGINTVGNRIMQISKKYYFLLQQLIERDFKTKYKRSVLGVCWSFLNPLLTMLVQYIVFSTLFRSDIPNYPVYLLIGVLCYSYFTDSIGQCMVSIIGNATLITKVYVPKYIYPLSKALSSGINLLLSLIPLVIVMFLTGVYPKPAFLLLPFGLGCLLMLCLGLGMLLATSMVFFRDTQFLWGVISMLWMYGTPIFYPESIIPEKLMVIYKMNPLYHIIRFCRTILIDGVSPEPKAYLLCLAACAVPFIVGVIVFKKQQDKFILHI